jgi:hypothetical protein
LPTATATLRLQLRLETDEQLPREGWPPSVSRHEQYVKDRRRPRFLALFLVVRATPALLLCRRDLPPQQLPHLALFSVTALPLVVVIAIIGVAEGRRPVNAAALVGAGILSALLYP